MADMQISVRFGREAGMYGVINTLCQVFIDFHFDKVSGNDFFLLIVFFA